MTDEDHNWPAWDSDKLSDETSAAKKPDTAGAEDAVDTGDEPTQSWSTADSAASDPADEHTAEIARDVTAQDNSAHDDDTVRVDPVQDNPGHDESGQASAEDPTVTDAHPVSSTPGSQEPGGDDATTQFVPVVPPEDQDAGAETDQFAGGILAASSEEPGADGTSRRLGKAMLVTGGVLALLILIYGIDLFLSRGDVPRGVTVAGVDVGGMSQAAAEDKLRAELEPRFTEPVLVTAGDVETELDPAAAGLGIDWTATLDQAGRQPINPITRVTSLFTEREVGIVGQYDEGQLTDAVSALADDEINRKKAEGAIRFEEADGDGAVTAVAVEPKPGQHIADIDAAVATIGNGWLQEGGVTLDVRTEPVKGTAQGVRATLEGVVEPAIAAPIQVRGDGADTQLRPVDIAEAFSFVVAEDGSLDAETDEETLIEILRPRLASTEQEAVDAEIVFEGGRPTVKPSKDGQKINWESSLEPYPEVISRKDQRVLEIEYDEDEPEVTTEQAEDLGIKEVIGEFTTRDFAQDSGVNIRRVAEQVNGAIVKPGDTFSLNGHTGPRTAAQGYVDAGIIQDGVPGRAVGGGISQFATTLYNATYFAGLKDAGHKEHSYYISRYPVAREATVFQAAGGGGIDIAFTNDAPTGVAIQTQWSSNSITVKIWGTKRYRVESRTSDKKNIKEAGERVLDTENCVPSPGIDGFTATDTRIIYDINSGAEVRRETRTVTYNPKPEIKCRNRD